MDFTADLTPAYAYADLFSRFFLAGCTAISGASAACSTLGSYYRGIGIFL
jgi:hypothetical protein